MSEGETTKKLFHHRDAEPTQRFTEDFSVLCLCYRCGELVLTLALFSGLALQKKGTAAAAKAAFEGACQLDPHLQPLRSK